MKLEPLLYVSDLNKSIKFYTDVLGFRLGELYPNSENPTYAPIFIGDNKLMIVIIRDTNKKFIQNNLGGSGVQFFIQVDGVDDTYTKIKNQVEILDEIETKPRGDREFTIKDLDGYLISFYTPKA
ncbi:MAG: VOC family protein [bacterium]